MTEIKLGKLVAGKRWKAFLPELFDSLSIAPVILDESGRVVFSSPHSNLGACAEKVAVRVEEKIVGWVVGNDKSRIVADFLSNLAFEERGKRAVVKDALEKYQEITLLLGFSEKLTGSITPQKVAVLVLEQAMNLIRADLAILYLNAEDGRIEPVAALRGGHFNFSFSPEDADCPLVMNVVSSCKGEIINDLKSDGRFMELTDEFASVMCVPMCAKDQAIGAIRLSCTQGREFAAMEMRLLLSMAIQAATAIENARLFNKIRETFFQTVNALAEIIELRDPYTGGHTKRVMNISIGIAGFMKLTEKELNNLRLAAILHDIGKIGIDDSVLKKEGRLTDEEYNHIKTHPMVANDILTRVDGLEDILPGVKGHHERFDGRGYPEGLSGEDIPQIARIIAVADTFDAMTSDRPYRRGMECERAVAEIRKHSGTQFDPRAVDAFLKLIASGDFDLSTGGLNI